MIVTLLMCGCVHRSYHPWLDEELLIRDDRLAGVWQGDLEVGDVTDGSMDHDLLIISPVAEVPAENEQADNPKIPAGYYAVSVFDSEKLETEVSIEHPFIIPDKLIGALYQLDDILIAQMQGNTAGEKSPLVAPLYVVYKAVHENDELQLFQLILDNLNSDDFVNEGLLLDSNDKGPYTFFSETEVMTGFLRKHLHEPEFFAGEPSMIFKRIRDIRTPAPEAESAGSNVEELVPTQQ